MSGSMGFTEFKELAGALNGWKQNFVTMDRDRSGTIEAQEMQQALGSMGRNKDFILIQRWSSCTNLRNFRTSEKSMHSLSSLLFFSVWELKREQIKLLHFETLILHQK
jgi:hypothetical protein